MIKYRIRIISITVLFSLAVLAPQVSYCQSSSDKRSKSESQESAEVPEEEDTGHSLGHRVLFYLPDRALDVFDIFRFRARVGPGLAAGVRATKVAQVYAGSYASVYAGLPGPRQRCLPRSPVGLESLSGVDVSVVEASVSGGIGPDYSPTEFGLGTQLAILGFDFGVDPYEILDFVVGIAGFDLRDDDC